ncbi:MAG: CBS domain-containing protein [Candidatus Manganitrophaceae bacterium]
MLIREIYTRNVVTARPEETLQEAAKKMWSKNVGAVVVIDEEKVPIGIVTDRDITIKGVAQGRDLESTPVKEVMSQDIVVLSQERDLFQTTRIMCEQGIRRIPVVDGEGRLSGIVSLDDILMTFGQEMANLAGTIAYRTAIGTAGKKKVVG